MAKVSIVVPSYNHASIVGETIRSVLEQSFADIELIIVDDASSDGSQAVLKPFSSDPRVRITLLNQNVGAPVAMNIGASQATGDYIAFCGSDDVFETNKIAEQLAVLEARSEVAVVFTRVKLIDETGVEYAANSNPLQAVFSAPPRLRAQWLNHFFVHGNCLCQSSALIRRSVFEACERQDPRLTQLHDFALWVRAAQRGDLHIVEQPLTRYRKRRDVASLSDHGVESHLRVRWEVGRVLRHFLELSDSLADKVFGEQYSNARAHGWSLAQAVAFESARLPHPWHHAFALDVLTESLADLRSEHLTDFERKALAELRRLSGLLDPYSLRSSAQTAVRAQAALSRPTPTAPLAVRSWSELSIHGRR